MVVPFSVEIKMAEGGSSSPDLKTQCEEITSLLKCPLVKGDSWYLIDQKWLKQFKMYVGMDALPVNFTHPGPIDNSSLFLNENSEDIRENMIEDLEYALIPAKAWELLVKWYGEAPRENGLGQAICRTVVEYGMFVKHYKVEVYFLEFKLCENSNPDVVINKKFSKGDTIEIIEQQMRHLFDIAEDKETRLWNTYSSNTYEYLGDKKSTVQEAGLYNGQVLIIEQQNDDKTWPRQLRNNSTKPYSSADITNSTVTDNRLHHVPSNVSRNYGGSTNTNAASMSSGNVTSSTSSLEGGGGVSKYNNSMSNSGALCSSSFDCEFPNGTLPHQAGLCGLSNLGNTCFMNSALQCMSNTPPLTDYFLRNQYWDELNVDNPLGMKGHIAKFYGELIKTIWSGRCAYTVPKNFKTSVGKFAPQFSGYQQQDCQELMAFLLDGLHEDLNRVKEKPYIELKDAEGRPDEVVAEEAWNNYLKRNNSIIVDIFHGLLKSTVVCPKCSKVSVTFDPFCYLSLPLPLKKERLIEVIFVFLDPKRKHLRLKVSVPKQGIVQDLCHAIGELLGIASDCLTVTEIYNHRFHKFYQLKESLTYILDKDTIYVFETPSPNDDSSLLLLPVFMRKRKSRVPNTAGKFGAITMNPLLGNPILIPLSKKNPPTYEALYNILMKCMSKYVREPNPHEEWWQESSDEEMAEDWSSKVNGRGEIAAEASSSRENDEDMVSSGSVEDSGGGGGKVAASSELGGENEAALEKEKEWSILYKCPPRLFSIHSVNSYGSVELDKLLDDGKPLKLTSKTCLAIDWHPKAKEKLYDDAREKEIEDHESMSNSKQSQKKQSIQLSECLKLFTTTEQLGADDPWYCPACKRHQQATKKFDLWSLPRVLIIHLKRFSYTRCLRDKLDVLIDFPVDGLDMSNYVINPNHPPSTYDLIAVANHYGGMGGGHYTAYAKNKNTGLWWYFDDASVNQASPDSVVSKAAYVLFYMRREVSPPHRNQRNKNLPAALGAAPIESGLGNVKDEASSDADDEDMDYN